MPVNVVSEWLNACSGCEISILNTGEALLDLLSHLNFVHIPALVDHKYFGQLGDGTTLEIPEAVVGIVSGGVRNTEHEHVLKAVREKVKILIAWAVAPVLAAFRPRRTCGRVKRSSTNSSVASPPSRPRHPKSAMYPCGPPVARPWTEWSRWISPVPAVRPTRIGAPT